MINNSTNLAIVIKDGLNIGLTANICSVIATSFTSFSNDILGIDIETPDLYYNAITKIPIIILADKRNQIPELIQRAKKKQVDFILYDKLAVNCHSYDEYIQNVQTQPVDEREILGVGLVGNETQIKKLTGNLPLLR